MRAGQRVRDRLLALVEQREQQALPAPCRVAMGWKRVNEAGARERERELAPVEATSWETIDTYHDRDAVRQQHLVVGFELSTRY